MQPLTLDPIGQIKSPFTEKFGIPRQPGLAPSITSEVILEPKYSSLDAVAGLEHCTHIWLLFIFSQSQDQGWKPKVRPPRLGGNQKLGVFATRSPFRPNPIGLSVVELLSIKMDGKQLILSVRGADLMDGTPIVDIKPYLPYADALPEARFELAEGATKLTQTVVFYELAQLQIKALSPGYPPELSQQIIELLSCDPRPAYQRDEKRIYGVRLYDLDIRFSITPDQIRVFEIEKITTELL